MKLQSQLRYSLATLFGAILAVAVFCGLLRYSLTEENYLIAGEMAAGFLLPLVLGLLSICLEKTDSLLDKVVMTVMCAVLLADALGIITLGCSWIWTVLEYAVPEWLPRGGEYDYLPRR